MNLGGRVGTVEAVGVGLVAGGAQVVDALEAPGPLGGQAATGRYGRTARCAAGGVRRVCHAADGTGSDPSGAHWYG